MNVVTHLALGSLVLSFLALTGCTVSQAPASSTLAQQGAAGSPPSNGVAGPTVPGGSSSGGSSGGPGSSGGLGGGASSSSSGASGGPGGGPGGGGALPGAASVVCKSTWTQAVPTPSTVPAPTAACRVSIDGAVLSCTPDPNGSCTIPLAGGVEVGSARVDFAFDPNDAAFPAGETCEQDLGTVVRDGAALRFTSIITCAASPSQLPSATMSTFDCAASRVVAAEQDGADATGNVVGRFGAVQSMSSCDVLVDGAPASCTLPAATGGPLPTCALPWKAPAMVEIPKYDVPPVDAFGRTLQSIRCKNPSPYAYYGQNAGIENPATLLVSADESCDSAAGLSLTINGSAGAVVAPVGSYPVVDWSAGSDAGDCVLESFNPPIRTSTPARSTFVSGTGSTGEAVATTPMVSLLPNTYTVSVVLTCTDVNGSVAQSIGYVSTARAIPGP